MLHIHIISIYIDSKLLKILTDETNRVLRAGMKYFEANEVDTESQSWFVFHEVLFIYLEKLTHLYAMIMIHRDPRGYFQEFPVQATESLC